MAIDEMISDDNLVRVVNILPFYRVRHLAQKLATAHFDNTKTTLASLPN